MVCTPLVISSVIIRCASTFGLRRSIADSSSGGFQSTNLLAPEGEPSLSTTLTGTPSRSVANSPGFPMVAEQQMNCGAAS